MSVSHSVHVVLNTSFDYLSVETILKRGIMIGVEYCSITYGNLRHETSYISVEHAAKSIISTYSINNFLNNNLSLIFQGVQLSIMFSDDKSYLSLMIVILGNHNYLGNWRYVDFAFYIKFLLNLCSDFSILFLQTSDDDYDDGFYVDDREPYPQFQPQQHTMPWQRRCDVTLYERQEAQHVRKMIENGYASGWKFFIQDGSSMRLVSVDHATEVLLNNPMSHGFMKLSDYSNHYPLLCFISEKWYGLIIGLRVDPYRTFSLIEIIAPGEKISSDVSFDAVIHHALDLCKDFCIIEFVTFDAWSNSYKFLVQ